MCVLGLKGLEVSLGKVSWFNGNEPSGVSHTLAPKGADADG